MTGYRCFLAGLLLAVPATGTAQVGHAPASSPYRDLTQGRFLAPQVAFFQGGGGQLGIAPHSGTMLGFRAELLGNRVVTLGLEVSSGSLERLIVDADDPVDARVSGPVDQRLTTLGVNFLLNLTGTKSWRGIAPYAGSGAGLATAPRVAADTSGWNFGTRFYFAPTLGVRVFLGRSVYLRAEARSFFTQLKYPTSYRDEPADDPGSGDDSHAVLAGRSLKEWTSSGVYTIGIGMPFPWPF